MLPGSCDLLTISKLDLQRVESDYEDMVSEIFLDSYKKIRRILKIKDKKEFEYLQKKAEDEAKGI